jgi:hypothetical protein
MIAARDAKTARGGFGICGERGSAMMESLNAPSAAGRSPVIRGMLARAGSGCERKRTQAACFRAAWVEAACARTIS